MENNITTTDPVTEPDTTPTEDIITMSKADYDKAVQSAEDKVRGKLSKEIKTLQDKIAELTPAQKSEAEVELENRLTALEVKERETAEKERMLTLRGTLQESGIDQGLAEYLKADVDSKALVEVLDKVVASKIKATGYQPTGHQNNTGLTREEYNKLSYEQRAELYRADPDLLKRFKN